MNGWTAKSLSTGLCPLWGCCPVTKRIAKQNNFKTIGKAGQGNRSWPLVFSWQWSEVNGSIAALVPLPNYSDGGSESQPGGSEGQAGGLRASQWVWGPALGVCLASGVWGPVRGSWGPAHEGRTDGRKEDLPILQDFVPNQDRCPKISPSYRTLGPLPKKTFFTTRSTEMSGIKWKTVAVSLLSKTAIFEDFAHLGPFRGVWFGVWRHYPSTEKK